VLNDASDRPAQIHDTASRLLNAYTAIGNEPIRGNAEPFVLPGDVRRKAAPPHRINRILVPLDGSPLAEHAIPVALALAAPSSVPLHLVHVRVLLKSIDDSRALYFEDAVTNDPSHRMRKYLRELGSRVEKVSTSKVSTACLEGLDVAASLAEITNDSTLVVMATHGRGALGRFYYGSVARELLDQSLSPLVVVRGSRYAPRLSPAPRMRRMATVVDDLNSADRILVPAARLCDVADVDQTLLHVAPAAPYYGVPWEAKRKESAQRLEAAAGRLWAGDGPPAIEAISSDEAPGEVLLSYAQAHGFDLMAAAVKRRAGFLPARRQDAVEYLMRRSTMPMLLVGPRAAIASAEGGLRMHVG
jgi:nucleotide-binding universal stress UspA family protein